eukprot:6688010-Alexandrium_andersonii.AAC.1
MRWGTSRAFPRNRRCLLNRWEPEWQGCALAPGGAELGSPEADGPALAAPPLPQRGQQTKSSR